MEECSVFLIHVSDYLSLSRKFKKIKCTFILLKPDIECMLINIILFRSKKINYHLTIAKAIYCRSPTAFSRKYIPITLYTIMYTKTVTSRYNLYLAHTKKRRHNFVSCC